MKTTPVTGYWNPFDKRFVISSCPIEPYEWTTDMDEKFKEAIKKVKEIREEYEDNSLLDN